MDRERLGRRIAVKKKTSLCVGFFSSSKSQTTHGSGFDRVYPHEGSDGASSSVHFHLVYHSTRSYYRAAVIFLLPVTFALALVIAIAIAIAIMVVIVVAVPFDTGR